MNDDATAGTDDRQRFYRFAPIAERIQLRLGEPDALQFTARDLDRVLILTINGNRLHQIATGNDFGLRQSGLSIELSCR